MGIVRDLFYAKKMGAGLKLPAPSPAALIKRMKLAQSFASKVKNLFEPLSGTSNGITFTPQSDGTVKAAGTATAEAWTFVAKYIDLPYGDIEAGDEVTIWSDIYAVVYAYNGSTSLGNKPSMNGTEATYTIPDTATRIRIIQYAKSTKPAASEEVDAVGKYYLCKGDTFNGWTPYEAP